MLVLRIRIFCAFHMGPLAPGVAQRILLVILVRITAGFAGMLGIAAFRMGRGYHIFGEAARLRRHIAARRAGLAVAGRIARIVVRPAFFAIGAVGNFFLRAECAHPLMGFGALYMGPITPLMVTGGERTGDRGVFAEDRGLQIAS